MKRFCILTLLLLMGGFAFSQEQIVYENSTKESYLVKYDRNNDRSQRIINEIIQEIAKQPRKNAYNTQITFSFIAHTRITKKNNNFTTYFDLKNFNCHGDVFYKEFNISDVLLPSRITFSAQLLGQNNRVLANYNVPDYSLNTNRNNFIFNYIDTLRQNNVTFQLGAVSFIYDEDTKRNFYNRLNLIDNYYNADLQLEKLYTDLGQVQPDNIDMLTYDQTVLANAQNYISETDRLKLDQALELNFFDPLDFIRKYVEFKNQAFNLQIAVNQTLSRLHEIYYNKGLEFIVGKNDNSARMMFQKSLEVNPSYAPPMYQLARMDLMDGNYEACAGRVQNLFNNMNPDPGTYKLCSELAKNLFDAYVMQADNFYNSKNYQDALNSYLKTENFFKSVRGYDCPATIYTKISLARVGIYNTFIDNANAYLRQGKLAEAEKEINDATAYQNNYAADIKDNKAATVVLTNIRQVEYKMDINEGKTQLTAKNYPAAFASFQKAEAIEKSFGITRSYELPGLLKTAAKPVIIAELNRGMELSNQNQLQEARNVLQNMITLQNVYGLSDDKTIINLLAGLRKKIFSQECQNAQNEFDAYIEKAKADMQSVRFIDADNEFTNAGKVVTLNSSCGIDRNLLDSMRLSVLPAITYQKVLVEVNGLLNSGNYENALNRYMDAEDHYYRLNVEKFGIKHTMLIDFIKNQENSFVIYAVTFFLNKEDPEKSLQLMRELKNRNYKSSKLKNEQKLLGIKLAVRDLKAGSKLPPKQAVIIYTNNDSWFKNLSKAYLKVFK